MKHVTVSYNANDSMINAAIDNLLKQTNPRFYAWATDYQAHEPWVPAFHDLTSQADHRQMVIGKLENHNVTLFIDAPFGDYSKDITFDITKTPLNWNNTLHQVNQQLKNDMADMFI